MDDRAGMARRPSLREHDRAVRVLFTAIGAAGATIIPFLSLLLHRNHVSDDLIGLINATVSFSLIAVAPIWSHFADSRFGSVRVLLLSTSLTAAAALLAFASFGTNLWFVFAAIGLMSAASAPATPLVDAVALTHLGPERMEHYGSIRLWTSAGWAVAVIAVGAIYQEASLNLVLPLYAAGMLAVAVIVRGFPRVAPEARVKMESRLGAAGDVLRSSSRLRRFLVGLFIASIATSASYQFVGLRIRAPVLIGLSAGVAAFIEVPIFRSSAHLVSRFGLRSIYAVGASVYTLCLLGFALTASPGAAAVIRGLWGIGFGFVQVGVIVAMGRLVPPHLRNTGQTVLQGATLGIGPVVGQAIGGFVLQYLGHTVLFGASAVGLAAGAIVAWTALGDERRA